MTQNIYTDNGLKGWWKRTTCYNSGLAKKRVLCFFYKFVVKKTFLLLMNFSANNPLLRQAAKRYTSP